MALMWPPEWILVLTALVLSIYVLGTWPYDYFKKRNLLFGNPKPFVGNLGPFVFKKKAFGDVIIEHYNRYKRYSVVGFFDFLAPSYMIKDPDIIKKIAISDFDHFTDHRAPVRADIDVLSGSNLFTLQGNKWKSMRHTLSPAFTSNKMKAMFLMVRDIGLQLADHLTKLCAEEKNGLHTIEMKELILRYESDVIATTAFGIQCNSMKNPSNEFYKVGRDVINFGGIRGLKLLGCKLSSKMMKMLKVRMLSKYTREFFTTVIHSTIETRERENIIRPDMIHLLMQANKGMLKYDDTDDIPEENGDDGNTNNIELSRDEITSQALMFFIAGSETSASLMCFMCHLLAIHPDIQRRVQHEMDDVLEEDNGILTYEGLQKMKYLGMVINETLRIYPPGMVNERQCVKPYVIPATSCTPAVLIKKGDSVFFPVIAIHRDPEYFPNPMYFDPDRFSEENKHNIRPFTYMPFGMGPRNCIGMRFALMSTKIAITFLLTKFDLEVVAKTPSPMFLDKKSFITIGLEGGFWLGIRPRVHAAL